MRPRRRTVAPHQSLPLPIWLELLVGVEMFYLRISPVNCGYGIPRGNGSAVVVVPGFMGSDRYLKQFREWLSLIGYRAYSSGIGLNTDCPNLLMQQHLYETIRTAYKTTGKKIHLIGHSLGGLLARAAASQMPDIIASVITLGSPFRGIAVHPAVLRALEAVRLRILERHGENVLPRCYTAACTCNFLNSLTRKFPRSVRQTAVYAKTDGLVDWHACITGDPAIDCEVSATHLGMVFSPLAYSLVAHRLAGK